jgi:hypothetical protein
MFSVGSAAAFAVTTNGTQTITGTKTFLTNTASDRGLVVRGQSGQVGNLQEWQHANTSVSAGVGPGGAIWAGPVASLARLSASATDAADKVFVVRAFPSQTARLIEAQNSAGSAVAYIDGGGGFWATGDFGIGSVGILNGVTSTLSARNPADITLKLRLASGQTSDLIQWESVGGSTIARITAGGGAVFGGSASLARLTALANGVGDIPFVVRQYDTNAGNANMTEWRKSDNTVMVNVGNGVGNVAFNVNEPPGLSGNDTGLVMSFSGVGSRRVLCGAADSGGTGYRMLRITN